MRRRQFLTGLAGAGFAGMAGPVHLSASSSCVCAMLPVPGIAAASGARNRMQVPLFIPLCR